MPRQGPHHLFDIEHALSNMERLLHVWHDNIPQPVADEFWRRIGEIGKLTQDLRLLLTVLLARSIYPMRVARIRSTTKGGKTVRFLQVANPTLKRRLRFRKVET